MPDRDRREPKGVRVGHEALTDTVDILSDAFSRDPIFDWFLRADAKREAARRRFFEFVLGEMAFADGEVSLAGEAEAAAVWIPAPGPRPSPLVQELQALPLLLSVTGWGRFGRLNALRAAMDAHHLKRPHAYLWFLGVRSDRQGKGLGSRLLDETLAPIDTAGVTAFLETAVERNVALYQSRGFRVTGRYRPGSDGPLTWAMVRDPA
jgi:ribosomal protein S18 acetylase RimI-like enzyme